jgi:hypothetical protein
MLAWYQEKIYICDPELGKSSYYLNQAGLTSQLLDKESLDLKIKAFASINMKSRILLRALQNRQCDGRGASVKKREATKNTSVYMSVRE